MVTSLRLTDVFAGAGGITRGFVQESEIFVPTQAVEFNRDAAATYRANYPLSDIFYGDISTWVSEGLVQDTDVLVGGPPCQGFSAVGKRKVDDEKNFLWKQYAHALVLSHAQYFVMENVPQFETSPQRELLQHELDEGILRDYSATSYVVDTASYGAPQRRKRMIVLGHHKDVPALPLPEPTHSPDSHLTVRDAFKGLSLGVSDINLPQGRIDAWGVERPGTFTTDQLHLGRRYAPVVHERMENIPEGGSRLDLPEHLMLECWKKTTGYADAMGRLHWDRPSVTIRTGFLCPEKGRFLHPSENRALTIHEGARLMGFPDTYKWVGSKTEIARQIGNAVPTQLSQAIARSLLGICS